MKGQNRNPSNLTLGLGTFAFKFTHDHTLDSNKSKQKGNKSEPDSKPAVSDEFSLVVLHQTVDKVVGTMQEARQLFSLVIFTETKVKPNKLLFAHGKQVLEAFIETVKKWAESAVDARVYKIYTFITRNQFWRQRSVKLVRPADSVILPDHTRNAIFADVEHFVRPATCEWYYRHWYSFIKDHTCSMAPQVVVNLHWSLY